MTYELSKTQFFIYKDAFNWFDSFLSKEFTEFILKKLKYEYIKSIENVNLKEKNEHGFLITEKTKKFEATHFVSLSLLFCSCLKLISLGMIL